MLKLLFESPLRTRHMIANWLAGVRVATNNIEDYPCEWIPPSFVEQQIGIALQREFAKMIW